MMTLQMPATQMERYQRTARARWEARRERCALRRERAWQLARRAAALLREEFGARRIVLFGSLARAVRFHERSDVDLAVWGLPARDYYRAVARLLDLDPTIGVDLIEAEYAPPTLRATLEREGVLL